MPLPLSTVLKINPTFSVVLPTFNRATTLRVALCSICKQSFQNWEIIVVDDGGTDPTETVVHEFQKENPDKRIVYLYQKNQGPAIARNTGVENASGNVIIYLDSDDYFYPSALEDIAWVLKDEQAQYGIANHNRTIRLIDQQGTEIARKYDASGLNQSVTLQQIYNWEIKTTSSGLFHRKSLFDKNIRWHEGFWIEDLEFMMQLAVHDPAGFRHIPKVLVDYTQTYGADGLCSNATYNDWAHAFESIYELHKNDLLMKNPNVYLGRIEKYKKLHVESLRGEIPPPQYKYFPELYVHSNKKQ